MALTSTRLTAEEYLALPPTEQRTQLINGEVVVTEPSVRHQRITMEIVRQRTAGPQSPVKFVARRPSIMVVR